MNNEKLLERQSAVFQMGLLFNQQPTDERILAYARALMNYTPKQIVFAFNQVILSGSAFFPSLAEVLKHLRPPGETSKDVGNMVANEIIQACIDHGRYQTNKILESLSPLASSVVDRNRYLILEILDSEKDQLTSIRAQIRDLVSASNESIKNNEKTEKLAQIGISKENVLPMKKIDFNTQDLSGFLPSEGA
jgi:hypothetical protein